MKIAIYHNLPSGGGKRALLKITQHLCLTHKIDVFSLTCAEHKFDDIRPYVNNYSLKPFSTSTLFRKPFGRLNQLIYLLDLLRLDSIDRSIAQEIDHQNYDVVYVHHCRYRQSPGVLRFLKTPTVYYCQEPPRKIYDPTILRPYKTSRSSDNLFTRIDPLPSLYLRVFRDLDQLNVRASTKILVNSHHSQENIWRIYNKCPDVCYLGVDGKEFKNYPSQREQLILSVGSINPIKGYDFLIEGIACLPEKVRPTLLIISNNSDPSERSFLENLAAQRGVNLQIKELVSNDDLAKLYSKAILTGYTPVLEPFGLVPLESMACETPVVGLNEGGVRETIIDGFNGKLVERDPSAFAEAVNFLLMNPDAALEMGRQGRKWVVEKWNWDRSSAKIEQIMINVAHSN